MSQVNHHVTGLISTSCTIWLHSLGFFSQAPTAGVLMHTTYVSRSMCSENLLALAQLNISSNHLLAVRALHSIFLIIGGLISCAADFGTEDVLLFFDSTEMLSGCYRRS